MYMKKLPDMSDTERIQMIESLNIQHPYLVNILKKIEHCHKFSPKSREAACMLITGWQGVGKTTVSETYVQSYPSRQEAEKTIIPVLCSVIPVPASPKALVTELLSGLGDPIPDKGTMVSQTLRLLDLLIKCEVELIILDEFQHVIDRESLKILLTTADWLKNLLSKTQIPIILIGMPSCTAIFSANPQLRRRFSIKCTLPPFKWTTPGADDNEIQLLLQTIDTLLPLKYRSNLSDPEISYRIYCATGGFMASIMKLIRSGARKAIETGEEKITLRMLEEIYEDELAAFTPEYPNPFSVNYKRLEPITIEELTHITTNGKRPKTIKNLLGA